MSGHFLRDADPRGFISQPETSWPSVLVTLNASTGCRSTLSSHAAFSHVIWRCSLVSPAYTSYGCRGSDIAQARRPPSREALNEATSHWPSNNGSGCPPSAAKRHTDALQLGARTITPPLLVPVEGHLLAIGRERRRARLSLVARQPPSSTTRARHKPDITEHGQIAVLLAAGREGDALAIG